ncbi:hypothetical protein ACFB49_33750 [Sphingomonas sp. DBB INV C78]
MEPAQLGWLGVDLEPGMDQMLVIALARPRHDAMLAEGNGLAILILGDVTDAQQRHDEVMSR